MQKERGHWSRQYRLRRCSGDLPSADTNVFPDVKHFDSVLSMKIKIIQMRHPGAEKE